MTGHAGRPTTQQHDVKAEDGAVGMGLGMVGAARLNSLLVSLSLVHQSVVAVPLFYIPCIVMNLST